MCSACFPISVRGFERRDYLTSELPDRLFLREIDEDTLMINHMKSANPGTNRNEMSVAQSSPAIEIESFPVAALVTRTLSITKNQTIRPG
jgi:hypothetical protein